jgi:hypothetical protein
MQFLSGCGSTGEEITNEYAAAAAFKRAEKNFILPLRNLKT